MFGDGDRYELIDGELYEMLPPDPIHEWAIRRIVAILSEAITGRTDIVTRPGTPAGLGESDVPVPDITLIQVDDNDYRYRHPGADDIYWVVEVANSKPSRERNQKKERYAVSGIADYWIVDLQKSAIILHRVPRAAGDYGMVWVVNEEDVIALTLLPDVTVDVAALKATIFG